MRIVVAVNGAAVLGGAQVVGPADDGYVCDCHAKLGNDFYFLPADACIHREDGICTKRTQFLTRPAGEKA